MLAHAFNNKTFHTFSLGTADISAIGVTHPDDVAQIRDGGRFDLTPWHNLAGQIPRLMEKSPVQILQDASTVVPYLYLQLDQSAGLDGRGDITATYNPEPNAATTRILTVVPPQP
ncbi:hypothetical protein ASG87_01685 [Frateuria sp. Soil773]|nr:hypothetical protein ASG87_01685 [Frateuria sp. Soil773]